MRRTSQPPELTPHPSPPGPPHLLPPPSPSTPPPPTAPPPLPPAPHRINTQTPSSPNGNPPPRAHSDRPPHRGYRHCSPAPTPPRDRAAARPTRSPAP